MEGDKGGKTNEKEAVLCQVLKDAMMCPFL